MTTLLSSVANRFKNAIASVCGTDRAVSSRLESLEGRTLMAISVINPIADASVLPGATATVLGLAGRYDNTDLNGTIVKFATDLGDINVLMYDQTNPGVTRTTPLTVANFLRYMDAGRYNQTVFHRSSANFVIQGGGFTRPTTDGTAPAAITTFPAVQNEPGNTNVRGTIAMAKLGSDANSATSQWFFNLGNNASNLDNQNGGFTVFGRVISGLNVMDAIAAQGVWNFGGTFNELPLRNHVQSSTVLRSEYIGMNVSTASELTYSVISSNPAVVNPTLNGTNLTLSYGTAGTSTVTLRVTCADGTTIDDVFTVRVNSAPFLAGLSAGASEIGRNSAFTLSLGTATDDGGISRIDFYRDSNSNGQLDIGTDTLLGSDTSATGGWNLLTNTNGLSLGSQRYFARATDTDGTTSPVVTTTMTVVNAAPVVSALTASPNPAEGRIPVTLTATASDSDGTVAFVRFYHDSNGNGVLDLSTDTLLGEDTNGTDGYSTVVDTSSFTFGSARYFAAATDIEALAGSPATVVGVINAPFSVGTLTSSATTVLRGAQIILTAGDVFIPAGKRFKALEFYADTNANGTFDVGIDKKIGAASALKNGIATAKALTKGAAVGDVKFFARVQDNLLAWSPAKVLTVAVQNNTPTVGGMKVTPAIIKNLGDTVALTVASQKDLDGSIASVRYYRDISSGGGSDGIFDAAVDTLLGTVTLASGGFKLAMGSANFTTGVNRFFAVVVDNNGAVSAPVTATATINAAPTITTVAVTPNTGTALGTTFTFTASGVGDSDGTIKSVEFIRDVDGSGTFDSRIDKALGKAKLINGVWTLVLGPKKLPVGTITVLARAMDKTGAYSTLSSVQLTVT